MPLKSRDQADILPYFEKNQKNVKKGLDKRIWMWYSIKAVSENEQGSAESDRTLKIEQRIDEKEKTCQFLKSSRNTTQGKSKRAESSNF